MFHIIVVHSVIGDQDDETVVEALQRLELIE